MVEVVALATDEADSVEEVETEEKSADTVDPDVDELDFMNGVKDTMDNADVDVEETDSVEEVETEEDLPDTVDADARLAVLPEDSVVDEVEVTTEED